MADANTEFLKQQFGAPPPDANSLFLQQTLGVPTQVPPGPKQAQDIGDAIIAGMQSAGTGLAIRGKLPEMQLGKDAPWYHRLAAGAAGIAVDLPLSVVGAVAGAGAGGAAGTAVPVVGNVAGAAVGGAAGAFAAPMALREALMEAYSNNHAASWEGVWDIAKAGMLGGAKGAAIGGITGGAGRFVTPLVAPAAGRAVLAGELSATGARRVVDAAALGTELAALTTTAAALEGKMPTSRDFMDNAILLGGMKGAVAIAKGMRNVYADTGRTPDQVLGDAARDPKIAEQLAKGDTPEAYAPLVTEQRIKASFDADARPALVAALMKQEKDPTAKVDSPVKYDYIFDKETADGVVRVIADVYDATIKEQTRGTVSARQSIAEGVAAIKSGEMTAREIGTADSSGILSARALLAKGAAENAQKLAETLPRDPAEWSVEHKLRWAGAMEQVSSLYGEYRGAGAEVARSLNMLWQLKRNPGLLANAEAMVKLYERDAKNGNFAEMTAMVRSFKDPTQVRAFADKLNEPSRWARFIEPWRAAIFSGPMTWQANIMGNVARWAIELPVSGLAATATATRRALTGDPLSMEQYKARALAPLYGAQLAALDGLHLIAEGRRLVETNGWAKGTKEIARQTAAAALDSENKIDVYRQANRPGSENILESAAGYFASASFGMLKLQDMPFRTIGERTEAYVRAVDRATEEGWHPKTREWTEVVAKYVETPGMGLSAEAAAKVMARIALAGDKAVFTEPLGPTTEKLSSAISGTPWEFLLPARRTPANLLSWSVQHTPGLNLLSGRWREEFMAGGERRDTALARVAVGTAFAATAYGLVANGMLTGGGLMETDISRTKAGAGIQNYSLLLDGEYYSVQRIEPVAKLLMLTADMHEIITSPQTTEQDKSKAAAMVLLAFGNATISTTYLSGLANTMRAVLDPARYAQPLKESYASSLVPKIIGQPVAMMDPYKREVDGALEAIQAQTPFLREKLLPKRDVWGEPQKNGRWFDVMPIATSEASKDKVKTEAVRLQVAIADAPKYVNAVPRSPLKPHEKQIELTGEQRDIMREVGGKLAMEYLTPIVNAPDWKNIPDYAQAAIFKEVINATHKQGLYKALPPDDAARVKIIQENVAKILQQTEEARTR